MDRMKIEEAVNIASFLLNKKIAPEMIAGSLVKDGFTVNRAITIVRWARQFNLSNKMSSTFTTDYSLPELM